MPKKMRSVQYGARRFDEVILTQEQAEALCLEWQKTLGIQDWAVQVNVSRGDDMPLQNASGTMTGHKLSKLGVMHVRDHTDHLNMLLPHDMEKTIVHELLHIVLYPLKVKDKRDEQLEVVIEQLSSALVALKRGQPQT